ncbi:hypothetical protein CYMTET_44878, partial [Cymbomonas tetramitiformis]
AASMIEEQAVDTTADTTCASGSDAAGAASMVEEQAADLACDSRCDIAGAQPASEISAEELRWQYYQCKRALLPFEHLIVVRCGDHKVTIMCTMTWRLWTTTLLKFNRELGLPDIFSKNQKTKGDTCVAADIVTLMAHLGLKNPWKSRFVGFKEHLIEAGSLSRSTTSTSGLHKLNFHKVTPNRYLTLNTMICKLNHTDQHALNGPTWHADVARRFFEDSKLYTIGHRGQTPGVYERLITRMFDYPALSTVWDVAQEHTTRILLPLMSKLDKCDTVTTTRLLKQAIDFHRRLLDDHILLNIFFESGKTIIEEIKGACFHDAERKKPPLPELGGKKGVADGLSEGWVSPHDLGRYLWPLVGVGATGGDVGATGATVWMWVLRGGHLVASQGDIVGTAIWLDATSEHCAKLAESGVLPAYLQMLEGESSPARVEDTPELLFFISQRTTTLHLSEPSIVAAQLSGRHLMQETLGPAGKARGHTKELQDSASPSDRSQAADYRPIPRGSPPAHSTGMRGVGSAGEMTSRSLLRDEEQELAEKG